MTRTNAIVFCSDQHKLAIMRDEKSLSGSEVLAFVCVVIAILLLSHLVF